MRPVSNRRISTSAICRTNSVKLLRTSKGSYTRIDLKTVVLLALLPTAQLLAQVERASVSGIISDKTGAAMPGARWMRRPLHRRVKTFTVSNGSGNYYLTLLPGDYKISVAHSGFATSVVPKLTLSVAQDAAVSLALEVSSGRQQVAVADVAPLVDQETTGLGTTIESEKITELPLSGPQCLLAGGAGARRESERKCGNGAVHQRGPVESQRGAAGWRADAELDHQRHLLLSAAAIKVNRTSAEIGGVVAAQQVRSIPLNGRNWSDLMALAPGAIDAGSGGGSDQRNIRFAGRSRDDNNYTLDGIDNSGIQEQAEKSDTRLGVSLDAVAEFRVNSAVYTAESGSAAGGQINVVSKTGTNAFHGGGFLYYQNDKMLARGPFGAATLPALSQYQPGGNFGGPVKKNKSFFFANYEAFRQQTSSNSLAYVPSAAFRQKVLATSPALKPILDIFPTPPPSRPPPPRSCRSMPIWTRSDRC